MKRVNVRQVHGSSRLLRALAPVARVCDRPIVDQFSSTRADNQIGKWRTM